MRFRCHGRRLSPKYWSETWQCHFVNFENKSLSMNVKKKNSSDGVYIREERACAAHMEGNGHKEIMATRSESRQSVVKLKCEDTLKTF